MDHCLKPVGYNRCNLCGFQPTVILLSANKKVHNPQHKVVYRGCPKCLMISLDMDYANISSLYEKLTSYDQDRFNNYHFQEISETWETLRYIMLYESSILQGEGKFFYDIGCGAAGSLATFKSLGYKIGGCEPDFEKAKFARENKGFEVAPIDYNQKVLPPNSVDFFYCYHVIEHMERPFKTISTIHFHLKPNGLLYLEVPNGYDTDIYQLGFGHISMFIPFNLERSLRNAGFEIIAIINRSNSATHGFGLLARRHTTDCYSIEEYDTSYLSMKKKYVNLSELALRLNYGFFVERPRDLHTLEILYRWLFLFPGKQIFRSIRRNIVTR